MWVSQASLPREVPAFLRCVKQGGLGRGAGGRAPVPTEKLLPLLPAEEAGDEPLSGAGKETSSACPSQQEPREVGPARPPAHLGPLAAEEEAEAGPRGWAASQGGGTMEMRGLERLDSISRHAPLLPASLGWVRGPWGPAAAAAAREAERRASVLPPSLPACLGGRWRRWSGAWASGRRAEAAWGWGRGRPRAASAISPARGAAAAPWRALRSPGKPLPGGWGEDAASSGGSSRPPSRPPAHSLPLPPPAAAAAAGGGSGGRRRRRRRRGESRDRGGGLWARRGRRLPP